MYIRWEGVGPCDRVVSQIYTAQLRSSRCSVGHSWGCGLVDRWSPSVKDPKGVVRGDEESLDTDKRILGAATKCNIVGLSRKASWRCINLQVWVGNLSGLVGYFPKGEGLYMTLEDELSIPRLISRHSSPEYNRQRSALASIRPDQSAIGRNSSEPLRQADRLFRCQLERCSLWRPEKSEESGSV